MNKILKLSIMTRLFIKLYLKKTVNIKLKLLRVKI